MTETHVIIIAALLAVAFLFGAVLGACVTDNSAQIAELLRRIQKTETTMWQWRGELTALQSIGVEVRVIDVSAHAHVVRVTLEDKE
jgi:outer membrane lipoprotein-sorting protein